MPLFAFTGGVDAFAGYGDRWYFGFTGTWVTGETWSIIMTTDQGDITLGVGNLGGQTPTSVATFRARIYAALGKQFNFSDNEDPTSWEQQSPGAGDVQYMSQYGAQDSVVGFAALQGRLCVFGSRTVQIWQADADPNNFQLIQTIDSVGTFAPLSIQQLGDLDVLFLDFTGVRSLRSKEVTLNAYVDDVGSPIDGFLQNILAGLSLIQATSACSIVEPSTKNYMLFLKDTIWVLSRHPSAKVAAWSTFEPRGDDNALFVPQKFVLFNGQVYVRTLTNLYQYGGANNTTYDPNSQVTWQIPWSDDKKPGLDKSWTGIGAVLQGHWTLSMGTDPVSNVLTPVLDTGNLNIPNSLLDSTYDTGRQQVHMIGTHATVKGVSNNQSFSVPAIFSALTLYFNVAEVP